MAMLNATDLAATLETEGVSTVVLALSGGLDSMVLLELLHQARQLKTFRLQAVYINHGLSPDATLWAEHCARACAERNIEFTSRQIMVNSSANIEAAARDGRYQALTHFIDSENCALLTAHHADDQLETLMLALKRGAGVAGLSGMALKRPFAKGKLLRPLLNCSRQHILAFARQHQLRWVEDSSNTDNRFDRNYIRNVITPLLTGRWPAFTDTALRSMQHLAEQQQLSDFYTEQAMALCRCDTEWQLNLTVLQQQIPLQQDLVIRRWLARFQLNPSSQWLQTLRQQVINARQDAMPLLVLGGYQLRRYNQRLYLEQHDTQPAISCRLCWSMQSNLTLPGGLGTLRVFNEQGPGRLAMVRSEVSVVFGQLSLPFKPADQLQHKPLKQWFKLWHLPPWQRGKVPLLLHDDKLIAVAGYASAVSTKLADCWLDWSQN
ncbi:tRNA(Ile)-lysidine synthase [Arsukibacterium tuosuense]|uniref:tRNA(Ile)-lysidine synthase n=1 Tax=Arsukibacterium tuosuense TaxID=1323745 RepID=A0A285J4K9_9GAMM|nr:tRNA lysidine(34) synthetase TilS [Arsukibacterium tuosuense]SNY55255.1 tRNA(Ile)-lysidine synthase [Arsukibacterium tuosuense]